MDVSGMTAWRQELYPLGYKAQRREQLPDTPEVSALSDARAIADDARFLYSFLRAICSNLPTA